MPAVAELAGHQLFQGKIGVCIVEDDERRIAPEHETAGPDRTLSPTGQPAVLESLDSISVSIEDVLV
jgi:hypothetical protein